MDRSVHHRALVVDTHSDTLLRILDEGESFTSAQSRLVVSLPRMVRGGLDAQIFALWVDPKYLPHRAIGRAMNLAGAYFRMVADTRGRMIHARTPAQLRRAAAAGKRSGMLALEGGHIIENSLEALRAFAELGVMSMTLTHANTNDWCDSSQDDARWNGLNEFGRTVVRTMNSLGMIVDISHVSDAAWYQALGVSKAPPFASHSCCRALVDNPRNATDDMIRALAKKGGVFHIAYLTPWLNQHAATTFEALWTEFRENAKRARVAGDEAGADLSVFFEQDIPGVTGAAGVGDICDHIDHAVSLVGPEHVGIGADWDASAHIPLALDDAAKLPLVTQELQRRGYRNRELRLILGENFLRLWAQVQEKSKK